MRYWYSDLIGPSVTLCPVDELSAYDRWDLSGESVEMIRPRPLLALVTLFACTAASGALGQAQGRGHAYRLAMTVPLGAPDRWDYVFFDAASHRVFVAHGDRVSVVDGRSGRALGDITGMPGGTHGVAVSPATGRGYTDDGEAGTVVSFDLKTLKTGKTLKAAPDADGMVSDPLTGHVFIINGDSATATVVDPKTNAAITTVQVGGKLEAPIADGEGQVYINGAGNREIVRVSTRTNTVTARWPVEDCESPHGIAIDARRHRLFTSCVNQKLTVLNTETGAVVASLPIGKGTDAAAYDPVRRRVFSSNGRDGTLTVIQQDGADSYRVLDTVPTAVTGRTMDLDPQSGRIFIAAASIDAATSQPGARPKMQPGSLKLLIFEPAQ
jgi:YVTN family beta-propeller protein